MSSPDKTDPTAVLAQNQDVWSTIYEQRRQNLGPTVERGRPQPKLRLTFIPALAAILTAAREKKGAALESEEIIAIRDAGSCVAMEWEDAREMERSRGYADIDPERAVECWNAIDRANPG